jgi:hypothetical protein
VKFLLPQLPGGAVVQGARLRFSSTFNEYGAEGLATNSELACADGWGIAKQDWTGLVNADHYVDNYQKPNLLMSTAYYKPLDALSGWDHSPEVDVKWQVIDWVENPASNHGFILTLACGRFRRPPMAVASVSANSPALSWRSTTSLRSAEEQQGWR